MRFLIDGHNLIGQMADIRLEDPDDEAKLVAQLRRWLRRSGHRATVIFDGGLPGGRVPALSSQEVEVIFAPAGRPADPLIIGRIRKARDPGAWTVVSSDHAILNAAARRRMRVQRSEELAAALAAPPPPPAEIDPRELSPSEDEVEAWLQEFGRR